MSCSTNNIIIKNLSNKILDFNSYLDSSKSLIIKKCNNINIIVTNKINKIIVEKSNNISIHCNMLISGMDIEKSNNIIVTANENNSIPYMECYKSSVFLNGSIELYQNMIVSSDMTLLCNITL